MDQIAKLLEVEEVLVIMAHVRAVCLSVCPFNSFYRYLAMLLYAVYLDIAILVHQPCLRNFPESRNKHQPSLTPVLSHSLTFPFQTCHQLRNFFPNLYSVLAPAFSLFSESERKWENRSISLLPLKCLFVSSELKFCPCQFQPGMDSILHTQPIKGRKQRLIPPTFSGLSLEEKILKIFYAELLLPPLLCIFRSVSPTYRITFTQTDARNGCDAQPKNLFSNFPSKECKTTEKRKRQEI